MMLYELDGRCVGLPLVNDTRLLGCTYAGLRMLMGRHVASSHIQCLCSTCPTTDECKLKQWLIQDATRTTFSCDMTRRAICDRSTNVLVIVMIQRSHQCSGA